MAASSDTTVKIVSARRGVAVQFRGYLSGSGLVYIVETDHFFTLILKPAGHIGSHPTDSYKTDVKLRVHEAPVPPVNILAMDAPQRRDTSEDLSVMKRIESVAYSRSLYCPGGGVDR